MCVVASLAGGILGGFFLLLYQRHGAPSTTATASATQEAGATEAHNSSASAPDAQQIAAGQLSTPFAGSQDHAHVAPESARRDGQEEASATTADMPDASRQTRPTHTVQGGPPGNVDEKMRERQAPTTGIGDSPIDAGARVGGNQSAGGAGSAGGADAADSHVALRGALEEWVAATNARDIRKQMSFYNSSVNAFYLTRNVSREDVRAEKSRVFGSASAIDVRTGTPEIKLSPDGRNATMRFRKKYAIEGGARDRHGEVLQELRWQRTDKGWKIVSERDLRVLQ